MKNLAIILTILISSKLMASEDSRFIRLVLNSNVSHVLFGKIYDRSYEKMLSAKGKKIAAIAYRLANDEKNISEAFLIGEATIVDSQSIMVSVPNGDELYRRMLSTNYSEKLAIFFISAENKASDYQAMLFESDIRGFIVFPEYTGVMEHCSNLISCSCKGYFGGSACCTSPTCNVRLGICQQNSQCKKNGSCPEYTDCQCRKD